MSRNLDEFNDFKLTSDNSPQTSPIRADLDKNAGDNLSWQQLTDSDVSDTFDGVPTSPTQKTQLGPPAKNSQIIYKQLSMIDTSDDEYSDSIDQSSTLPKNQLSRTSAPPLSAECHQHPSPHHRTLNICTPFSHLASSRCSEHHYHNHNYTMNARNDHDPKRMDGNLSLFPLSNNPTLSHLNTLLTYPAFVRTTIDAAIHQLRALSPPSQRTENSSTHDVAPPSMTNAHRLSHQHDMNRNRQISLQEAIEFSQHIKLLSILHLNALLPPISCRVQIPPTASPTIPTSTPQLQPFHYLQSADLLRQPFLNPFPSKRPLLLKHGDPHLSIHNRLAPFQSSSPPIIFPLIFHSASTLQLIRPPSPHSSATNETQEENQSQPLSHPLPTPSIAVSCHFGLIHNHTTKIATSFPKPPTQTTHATSAIAKDSDNAENNASNSHLPLPPNTSTPPSLPTLQPITVNSIFNITQLAETVLFSPYNWLSAHHIQNIQNITHHRPPLNSSIRHSIPSRDSDSLNFSQSFTTHLPCSHLSTTHLTTASYQHDTTMEDVRFIERTKDAKQTFLSLFSLQSHLNKSASQHKAENKLGKSPSLESEGKVNGSTYSGGFKPPRQQTAKIPILSSYSMYSVSARDVKLSPHTTDRDNGVKSVENDDGETTQSAQQFFECDHSSQHRSPSDIQTFLLSLSASFSSPCGIHNQDTSQVATSATSEPDSNDLPSQPISLTLLDQPLPLVKLAFPDVIISSSYNFELQSILAQHPDKWPAQFHPYKELLIEILRTHGYTSNEGKITDSNQIEFAEAEPIPRNVLLNIIRALHLYSFYHHPLTPSSTWNQIPGTATLASINALNPTPQSNHGGKGDQRAMQSRLCPYLSYLPLVMPISAQPGPYTFPQSVWKSLLQKTIRQGPFAASPPAVRLALQLALRQGVSELIRRILIINVEDTCLHPAYPYLAHFMLLSSRKSEPNPILKQFIANHRGHQQWLLGHQQHQAQLAQNQTELKKDDKDKSNPQNRSHPSKPFQPPYPPSPLGILDIDEHSPLKLHHLSAALTFVHQVASCPVQDPFSDYIPGDYFSQPSQHNEVIYVSPITPFIYPDESYRQTGLNRVQLESQFGLGDTMNTMLRDISIIFQSTMFEIDRILETVTNNVIATTMPAPFDTKPGLIDLIISNPSHLPLNQPLSNRIGQISTTTSLSSPPIVKHQLPLDFIIPFNALSIQLPLGQLFGLTTEQQHLVQGLLLRGSFGGMRFDLTMCLSCAYIWLFRFAVEQITRLYVQVVQIVQIIEEVFDMSHRSKMSTDWLETITPLPHSASPSLHKLAQLTISSLPRLNPEVLASVRSSLASLIYPPSLFFKLLNVIPHDLPLHAFPPIPPSCSPRPDPQQRGRSNPFQSAQFGWTTFLNWMYSSPVPHLPKTEQYGLSLMYAPFHSLSPASTTVQGQLMSLQHELSNNSPSSLSQSKFSNELSTPLSGLYFRPQSEHRPFFHNLPSISINQSLHNGNVQSQNTTTSSTIYHVPAHFTAVQSPAWINPITYPSIFPNDIILSGIDQHCSNIVEDTLALKISPAAVQSLSMVTQCQKELIQQGIETFQDKFTIMNICQVVLFTSEKQIPFSGLSSHSDMLTKKTKGERSPFLIPNDFVLSTVKSLMWDKRSSINNRVRLTDLIDYQEQFNQSLGGSSSMDDTITASPARIQSFTQRVLHAINQIHENGANSHPLQFIDDFSASISAYLSSTSQSTLPTFYECYPQQFLRSPLMSNRKQTFSPQPASSSDLCLPSEQHTTLDSHPNDQRDVALPHSDVETILYEILSPLWDQYALRYVMKQHADVQSAARFGSY